jgi:hypothetical protein
VADVNNVAVRMISTSGIVSTVAGTGVAGYSGDGSPSVNAQLNVPYSVAFDSSGNMYIADNGNHRIRVVYAQVRPIGVMVPGSMSSYDDMHHREHNHIICNALLPSFEQVIKQNISITLYLFDKNKRDYILRKRVYDGCMHCYHLICSNTKTCDALHLISILFVCY